MIVPVSTSYSGNKSAARALTRVALAEMDKTERLMEFQGLQQWSRIVDFAPGVVITTSKCFGIRTVNIDVAQAGGGEEQTENICLCNCNFAFGVIIEQQEETLERDGEPKLYTVLVCRNKRGYVIEKDLLATDFSPYLPGQKVLLIPYNEALFRCCENLYLPTGCKPIKSEIDIAEDDWRTTMRIVPWRAFTLKKWIQVRG